MVLTDLLRTAIVLPIGLFATAGYATAVFLVGRRDPSDPRVQRLVDSWARTWLRLVRVDLEVAGRDHIDANRSYVVISNHLSNLDVMVCFLAVPLPIRFLAKEELFRVPILAQAMRAIGIVEVARGGRSAAIRSVNLQSEKVIARGHSLIIYPEGTRSRDGTPQPFKKGAFMMATAAEMPILPVAIAGTRAIWPPNGLIRRGGRVVVTIDSPVETSGLSRIDVERLRRTMEADISRRATELHARLGQS